MQITPEDILTDYGSVAQQVVAYYESMAPADQQYNDQHETALYHWHRSCTIGLGLLDRMPPPLTISNAQLVTDTWDFVSTSGRAKLQADDHPFYQAWLSLQ